MKETKEQLTSIGEIAQKLDMSQRTIRYYEEIGLLNSIKRVEGGRRVYTDDGSATPEINQAFENHGNDFIGDAGIGSNVDD